MKTKIHQHTSIHQHVERVLRHKISLTLVLGIMSFGLLSLDGRFRNVMHDMYAQGWGWIGTYLHHEHPAHSHAIYGITRAPRISGPGV